MNATSFDQVLNDVFNRKKVLELIDRYVNRDIKQQIIEAYNNEVKENKLSQADLEKILDLFFIDLSKEDRAEFEPMVLKFYNNPNEPIVTEEDKFAFAIVYNIITMEKSISEEGYDLDWHIEKYKQISGIK